MSAKEMFEKLGYEKIDENDRCLCYWHNSGHARSIMFSKDTISIMFNCKAIGLYELQAINKQCSELGWDKYKIKEWK